MTNPEIGGHEQQAMHGAAVSSMLGQLGVQALGVVSAIAYTAIVSFVILKLVEKLVGLRISDDEEVQGLDVSEHDERGYIL